MAAKPQDGPSQWLDIQQGQVHTTLAFSPRQVVGTILLSLLCHVVMTDPMTDLENWTSLCVALMSVLLQTNSI